MENDFVLDQKSKKITGWLEGSAWIFVVLSYILAIVSMVKTKGKVPVHYGIDGQVDRYGSSGVYLLIPIIMTFVLATFSLVYHCISPENWNTPIKVTEENKSDVFRVMCIGIMVIQFICGAMTFVLNIFTIYHSGLGLIISTCVMCAAMTVAVVVMIKAIKKYKID